MAVVFQAAFGRVPRWGRGRGGAVLKMGRNRRWLVEARTQLSQVSSDGLAPIFAAPPTPTPPSLPRGVAKGWGGSAHCAHASIAPH